MSSRHALISSSITAFLDATAWAECHDFRNLSWSVPSLPRDFWRFVGSQGVFAGQLA
jgi:hypothetical protein